MVDGGKGNIAWRGNRFLQHLQIELRVVDTAKIRNNIFPIQRESQRLSPLYSSAGSEVYKRQGCKQCGGAGFCEYKAGGVRMLTI